MNHHRVYGTLQLRAVDDEERIIEGIANTDAVDDYGTILEPKGARFALPFPLLWQHRQETPVGEVIEAKVTAKQIRIRARLAKITEPGPLKDEIDRAWQAVKYGLVKGLSVGFKPTKIAPRDDYDEPVRFIEWTLRELSLVTLPANQEATIEAIRSADLAALAASGEPSKRPGASGTTKPNPNPKRGANMLTILEQVREHENSRAAKVARQAALMEAAAAEGRTLDASEAEEYDTLADEVEAIDGHLRRLNALRRNNESAAQPVAGHNAQAAAESRGGSAPAAENKRGVTVVRSRGDHRPGIAMARVVRAVALAHRRHRDVETVVRELYPDDHLVQRAAVAAHTTTDSAALVSDEGGVFADFVEFLRPQTIIGQFGTAGRPNARAVPFRTPLITQTAGGTGYWVGQGAAKPLTRFAWTRRTLEPLKVANIAVITDELLRSSSPAADQMIRDSLVDALRERLDTDFIDPTKAAVAGISPASITNGLTGIGSSGTDEAAVRADIRKIFQAFIDADNPPTSGVWIMPAGLALSLSLMTTTSGDPAFPGITMQGGNLFGLPVILSQYVPTAYDPDGAGAAVAGSIVVLANATDIYLADEGEFAVDASREASLEMADNPTGSSATPTAATLVSMFQTNSVAIRAERTVNWARRRDSGVAMLTSVNWAP